MGDTVERAVGATEETEGGAGGGTVRDECADKGVMGRLNRGTTERATRETETKGIVEDAVGATVVGTAGEATGGMVDGVREAVEGVVGAMTRVGSGMGGVMNGATDEVAVGGVVS